MAPIESYSLATVERLSRQVASVLQRSGLVAIPTETFYGLGVNPFDARALDRLRAVKGREDAKPILVLVARSTTCHRSWNTCRRRPRC